LIQILTGHKISLKELNYIVDKVFAEADFYDNEKITLDEFEHIVSNSTEFARYILFFLHIHLSII
jgi:hypothetical protein